MKKTLITAAVVAAAGAAANADSMGDLEMRYRGGGLLEGGLNYSVTVGSQSRTADTGGELRYQGRNATGAATEFPQYFSSFCIELGQTTSGSWRDYDVCSILDAPNPQANSPFEAGYDYEIMTRIHAVVRAAMDEGIINERLQPTALANSGNMGAVQLGIWEAIWEQSSTLNLASGNSVANRDLNANNPLNNALAAILSGANNYLTLGGDFANYKVAGLVALTSSGAQDQLAVVPLPPAAFAGLGLLGAAGVVRRMRKS